MRKVSEEEPRHGVLRGLHHTPMQDHLMVDGAISEQGIRPRIRQRRRHPIAAQPEDGDVALDRDAPRRHVDDFIVKKRGLAAVEDFH